MLKFESFQWSVSTLPWLPMWSPPFPVRLTRNKSNFNSVAWLPGTPAAPSVPNFDCSVATSRSRGSIAIGNFGQDRYRRCPRRPDPTDEVQLLLSDRAQDLWARHVLLPSPINIVDWKGDLKNSRCLGFSGANFLLYIVKSDHDAVLWLSQRRKLKQQSV